jgi:predicted branched-subunit amino acid permease
MLITIKTSAKNGASAQFREGVIACLPTIPGYWSIGFAAGAIGTLSGFSTLQTALLASALYQVRRSSCFIRFGRPVQKLHPLC